MVFHLVEETRLQGAVIKVVGVGGGGGNALNYMVRKNIGGVQFICANTDMQALGNSRADTSVRLGEKLTNGLGAGADPELGRAAANEAADRLREVLEGADMVFITAGLGGGTGTGAAPVIAEIARSLGILTVAVVTRPFSFEGRKRMGIAAQGVESLERHVDSLITIPNDKLCAVFGAEITMVDAFEKANDVLYGAVQGIAELITCDGMVNLDFADVRTVMSEMGMAMIGSGSASGEGRAYEAAQAAIHNPLLEDMDLANVRGLLVNITSANVTIGEFGEIGECISELTADDANVVIGTVVDEAMEDGLRVTLVATGLGARHAQAPAADAQAQEESPQQSSLLTPEEGDYAGLEAPAVGRLPVNRPSAGETAGEAAETAPGARSVPPAPPSADENYDDYLEIPAFLRQQVD